MAKLEPIFGNAPSYWASYLINGDASGRKILQIPCGSQRSVTINAGR